MFPEMQAFNQCFEECIMKKKGEKNKIVQLPSKHDFSFFNK